MAVIDHDHSHFESEPSTASDAKPVHGLICASKFLAFWAVFLTVAWVFHAFVSRLF